MSTRRADYFTLGTALLVIAGIFTALNGNLYGVAASATPPRPYSFWTAWEMVVAYSLTAVALFLFASGFRLLPFPPWTRTAFPDIEIEINRVRVHQDDPNADRWIAFGLRVTSRESEQNASLSFRYRVKLQPDYLDLPIEETLFTSPEGEPPTDFPSEWLNMPLNLLPQHSVGGNYVARVSSMWTPGLAYPLRASLLIEDHVSGQAISIPVEGGGGGMFDRSNWRPAHRDSRGNWTAFPTAAADESTTDVA